MSQSENSSAAPTVSLSDIRGIYAHLPSETAGKSALNHPAILVFVHDPESAANALGQSFLRLNNDSPTRGSQPLAVAAQMIGADYKIFDLTPPARQSLPASVQDIALAMSYGMVTVEQGIDFVALHAVGQDTSEHMINVSSFDDIQKYGALNIAACYGAMLAARMAQIEITAGAPLQSCLARIASSEDCENGVTSMPGAITEFALELIRQRALRQFV